MSRISCLDEVDLPGKRADLSVTRLVWDWQDPSRAVDQELRELGEHIRQGCLYLNPMFKVFSDEPTLGFLREVRRCQREWFRVLTRQFGSANWRRKMAVDNLRERRMGFSGILFIKGQEIDPVEQWRLETSFGLHPEADLVISHRPYSYPLVVHEDWDALKDISRLELDRQLSANPRDALYVTPGITVMGISATEAFYAEVEKRSSEWHGRFHRVFGNCKARSLGRDADWATRLLVFNGTLVVDGEIYLSGCAGQTGPGIVGWTGLPLAGPQCPLNTSA